MLIDYCEEIIDPTEPINMASPALKRRRAQKRLLGSKYFIHNFTHSIYSDSKMPEKYEVLVDQRECFEENFQFTPPDLLKTDGWRTKYNMVSERQIMDHELRQTDKFPDKRSQLNLLYTCILKGWFQWCPFLIDFIFPDWLTSFQTRQDMSYHLTFFVKERHRHHVRPFTYYGLLHVPRLRQLFTAHQHMFHVTRAIKHSRFETLRAILKYVPIAVRVTPMRCSEDINVFITRRFGLDKIHPDTIGLLDITYHVGLDQKNSPHCLTVRVMSKGTGACDWKFWTIRMSQYTAFNVLPYQHAPEYVDVREAHDFDWRRCAYPFNNILADLMCPEISQTYKSKITDTPVDWDVLRDINAYLDWYFDDQHTHWFWHAINNITLIEGGGFNDLLARNTAHTFPAHRMKWTLKHISYFSEHMENYSRLMYSCFGVLWVTIVRNLHMSTSLENGYYTNLTTSPPGLKELARTKLRESWSANVQKDQEPKVLCQIWNSKKSLPRSLRDAIHPKTITGFSHWDHCSWLDRCREIQRLHSCLFSNRRHFQCDGITNCCRRHRSIHKVQDALTGRTIQNYANPNISYATNDILHGLFHLAGSR